jgi:hypothetical protein
MRGTRDQWPTGNGLHNLERAKGIEPSTYSLGSCRSTTELRPQFQTLSTLRKSLGHLGGTSFSVTHKQQLAQTFSCLASSGDQSPEHAMFVV